MAPLSITESVLEPYYRRCLETRAETERGPIGLTLRHQSSPLARGPQMAILAIS